MREKQGKEKPGVMLYWETLDALAVLDAESAKALIIAIRDYARDGMPPIIAPGSVHAALWQFIKPKIDADNERYEKISEQNRNKALGRWGKTNEPDNMQ
jgi:hypothetical protein